MRRKDREITDFNEILTILKKCDVCRLALFDEEYPYIIPLNFGFGFQDETLTLYFHCAKVGKKLDLIKRCCKAAFETDCSHNLVTGEQACDYTMEFESVCGNGEVVILDDSQKLMALKQLMKQYSNQQDFEFDQKVLEHTTVFKLTVNKITAKRLEHK